MAHPRLSWFVLPVALALSCASAPRKSVRYLAESIETREAEVRATELGKEVELFGVLAEKQSGAGDASVAVLEAEGRRAECELGAHGTRKLEEIPEGSRVAAQGVLASWSTIDGKVVPRLSDCWVRLESE